MLTDIDVSRIQQLKQQRYSQGRIARELSISRNTVRKYWSSCPLLEKDKRQSLGRNQAPEQLLVDLAQWLSAVCKAIPLHFSDENILLLSLRETIEQLDTLIIHRLKDDESERQRFFTQFIWESELGSRYQFECACPAFFELDVNAHLLPDLKAVLKQVLTGKRVKATGRYFQPFLNGKRKTETELQALDEAVIIETETDEQD